MRIRSVKPSFWRDSVMAQLDLGCRLFYIGLWMEADDAGYLEWSPSEIASDLFPYMTVRKRERAVSDWALALCRADRLELWECGHGFVPSLAEHQRIGGRPSFHVQEAHRQRCGGEVRTDTDQSVLIRQEGEGEGNEEGEEGEGAPSGPVAYYQTTLRYPQPSSNLYRWIVALAEEFGEEAFAKALALEFRSKPRLSDLMSRTQGRLRMEADSSEQPRSSETREAFVARMRALVSQGGLTAEEFERMTGEQA